MIVDQAGQIGLVEDIPGYRLPPGAWTTADNVRFNDGYAEKIEGHSLYATPSVAPYYLLPLQQTTTFYWIYFGLTNIYITDGSNHNAAGSGYSATADSNWNGDIFGGIPVVSNGIDAPQMLFPVSASNTFSSLTSWPSGYTCKSIKAFKNYLVALNVNKGTDNPLMVKWSHQADAGTLPSWDETDPTLDAGETTLSDSGGDIVDGGTLGDSFIIYRENSTYTMRYIGGRFIFSLERIFDDIGIFADRCFVAFKNGHCVLTDDDLIVHTGTKGSALSIADSRIRDTLFTALNSATNPTRAFLTHNNKKSEIWVCYPTSTDNFPTKALIWNYEHNTFSYRDLPGTMDAKFNVVQTISGETWASDSNTWASDSTSWGERSYNPSKRDILIADTTNTKLFKGDDTNQFNGVSFTSTLQRTDILLDQALQNRAQTLTFYPLISGTGPVNVRIGAQEAPEGTVTWQTAQSFTPGTDYKLDFRVNGRLLAVELSSTGDVDWRLHSWDFEYAIGSKN